MLWIELIIGSGMVLLTVFVHAAGLAGLVIYLQRHEKRLTVQGGGIALLQRLTFVTLAFFALHVIEIWVWAILYIWTGEFDDLSPALYFSTVTFTTLGYGDITLGERWQLLSAIESANGIFLFGVSTAAFIVVFRRTLQDLGLPISDDGAPSSGGDGR